MSIPRLGATPRSGHLPVHLTRSFGTVCLHALTLRSMCQHYANNPPNSARKSSSSDQVRYYYVSRPTICTITTRIAFANRSVTIMTIAVVPDPFGVHDTLSRWSRMLQYRSRSCHFSGDFHACEGECKGAGQLVVAVAPVSSLLQRLDPSNPVAYCVYVRSPYTKPCWVQYSDLLYLHMAEV